MTTWERAEDLFPIPNHCVLGEIGAAIWGLPNFVVECARYHHAIEFPEVVKHMDAIIIVGLANLLSHWINLEPHRIETIKLKFYSQHLKINDHELEKIAQQLSSLRTSIT